MPEDTSLQFAASSYQSRSLPLDAQRALNMFVERSPPDAKTRVPVFMCPGLSRFSACGAGPIRGLQGMAGVLYAVSGNQLFSVNENGLATLIGSTNLGGVCSMATNDTQMVIVDGSVGWIYQPGGLNQVTAAPGAASAETITVWKTGTLANGDQMLLTLDSGAVMTFAINGNVTPSGVAPGAYDVPISPPLPAFLTTGAVGRVKTNVLGQIRAPAFMPAATVVYFDGYFVLEASGTNQFFISGLGDGTQYDALDFASAQANPDYILAVVNYHEQLLLMGSKTIEVWYDSGAVNFPFQRFDGAFVQRGCASPLGICQEDNTVLWLGEDGMFYRLDGYNPRRISTFATEHAWAQYPTINDANCFVVTMEGHKFVFLNFPSGRKTWCYDISSGSDEPLWHERESWRPAVGV